MPRKSILAVAAAIAMTVGTGCSEKAAEVPAQSEQAFDAVQLFQDFEQAPPAQKSLTEKAWKAIQSGSFAEALKYLGQLEANPALNDAQKKSVADLASRVRKQMGDASAGSR
jgi:hypothetical protein